MSDIDQSRSKGESVFRPDAREIMFRSSALELLAVREHLDELFMVGRYRARVLLPAALMLLAAAAAWFMDW